MTFLRVRLCLETMAPGALLLVRLQGEEARRNVPWAVLEAGHAVEALEPEPDAPGFWLLTVVRGG